jgi:Flp pilus assembly protein TadG
MQRRIRRGANAVEFSLLLPVFVAMLAGLMDYGWYFWREALLINGMREAVRSGALQTPGASEVNGSCGDCISAATSAATRALSEQGYSVEVEPEMLRVPASGTPCTYAVRISHTIPHSRIFTLVPGPDSISVDLLSMAQNVTCE